MLIDFRPKEASSGWVIKEMSTAWAWKEEVALVVGEPKALLLCENVSPIRKVFFFFRSLTSSTLCDAHIVQLKNHITERCEEPVVVRKVNAF